MATAEALKAFSEKMVEIYEQLRLKKGPHYQKWKKNMIRAAKRRK